MIVHEICPECGKRKTVGEACAWCGALGKAVEPKEEKPPKKKVHKTYLFNSPKSL